MEITDGSDDAMMMMMMIMMKLKGSGVKGKLISWLNFA